MRQAIRYLVAGYVFAWLIGGQLLAQQVMPGLARRVDEVPGISLKTNEIKEDAQGRLWLATHNGLVRLDGRQFRVFHDPRLKQGDYYYHCAFSPDGRIWLKQDEGYALPYFDPQRQQIRRLADTTRLMRQYLAKLGCHYLFADGQANLWIGLRGQGLLRYNPRTGAIDHVFAQKANVRWITQDRSGRIWFTSDQGLYAYQPLTRALTAYRPDPLHPATSLGSLATYGVHVRPDGTLLVGLNDEVDLLNPATGQIRRLRLIPSTRFPRQEVFNFADDAQGNTYFATKTTLYRYTKRGAIERVELQGPMQRPATCLPSRSGHLWVSVDQTLYEYDLTQMQSLPPLNLLDVVVNGTRLETNSDDRRLDRRDSLKQSGPGLSSSGQTTLTVQENDLVSIRFSPYASWHSSTFRFRLQGYDQQWNVEEDLDATVNYQLPAGHYTFALNRSLKAGTWEKEMHTFQLIVQPPFWKTGWFLVLAGLTLATGLLVLSRSLRSRYKLRQQLLQRQMEADNLRQLNEMKTRFFTNITHEFRTPLTLILGPTEQLKNEAIEPRVRRQLGTIEQNAQQLLGLINQLLDLSRLEASVMPVQPSRGDLADCVAHWLAPLMEQASAQGITLSFQSGIIGQYWFDVEKLERIVYNLTANALKFTPAGSITVAVTPAQKGIQLTVADTGMGIAAQHLPHIFDRFYQAEPNPTAQLPGTGIGLALVKELVQLQQGTITVDSVPGQGTTFVVTLPYDKADEAAQPTMGTQLAEIDTGATPPDDAPKSRILLVEDNDDLAGFIAQSLSATYHIHRATNGLDGLRQALNHVPDLIISDVMMPGMDGLTLCAKLKTDLRTSHIPVLILTARATREDRLEGLTQGADEYLTKPFQVAELRLRVRNLLEQCRRQRNWVRQQLIGAEPTREPAPVTDPFLTRLYALLEANLSNPRLSVDQLTLELAMSRTNLHRKVKALTGFSANELVRYYRLKAATTLLRQGFNSAQTADQVGFESPSYFAKCFREVYGVTPAEFVRQQATR